MKVLFLMLLLVIGVSAQKDYIVSMKGRADVPSKGKIKEALPLVNGYVVTLTDEEADELSRHKRVRYVEENVLVYTQRQTQSPVPYWNLSRIDERLYQNPSDSYSYDYTGQGVDVYVMDTGIFVNDPEFEGRASKGYGKPPTFGCNTHGHGVASVVGGARHGVAKKVKLVDVHVFPCWGGAPVSEVVKGTDWIIRVAKRSGKPSIVNMSFGLETSRNFSLEESVRQLYFAGILSTVAAGNYGIDACTTSPAAATEGLIVSGFVQGDVGWGFNSSPACQNCGFNWGNCVDVYAPGLAGSRWVNINKEYLDGAFGGTSFAAPHGAGVAALYWEQHPDATVQEVHDAIKANATVTVLYNFPEFVPSPQLVIYSLFDGS